MEYTPQVPKGSDLLPWGTLGRHTLAMGACWVWIGEFLAQGPSAPGQATQNTPKPPIFGKLVKNKTADGGRPHENCQNPHLGGFVVKKKNVRGHFHIFFAKVVYKRDCRLGGKMPATAPHWEGEAIGVVHTSRGNRPANDGCIAGGRLRRVGRNQQNTLKNFM